MRQSSTSESILWRLHLASSPDRVYDAWLDPLAHAGYWCERSAVTPAGFRLEFIDGTVEECAVHDSARPARIVLRYFTSRVEITIGPAGSGTDLTLCATEVPAHDWLESHAGWLSVLLAFKCYVDHRLDIRNHDRTRTWQHRFADQ